MSFFLTSDLYHTLNVSCSPLFFLLLIVTPSPAAHFYDNCICTSVPLKRQSHKIFGNFFSWIKTVKRVRHEYFQSNLKLNTWSTAMYIFSKFSKKGLNQSTLLCILLVQQLQFPPSLIPARWWVYLPACELGWSDKELFSIFENGHYAAHQVYIFMSPIPKKSAHLAARAAK